jgi:hypothetical protein
MSQTSPILKNSFSGMAAADALMFIEKERKEIPSGSLGRLFSVNPNSGRMLLC